MQVFLQTFVAILGLTETGARYRSPLDFGILLRLWSTLRLQILRASNFHTGGNVGQEVK